MGSTSVAQNRITSMRRIIRLFAGLLVICTSSAAMAQSARGEMRVSVESKETPRPLEGVTVTVTDRDGKVFARRTVASGTVDLTGLEAGLYTVAADGPRLIAVSEPSVRVVDRKVTPLVLKMLAMLQTSATLAQAATGYALRVFPRAINPASRRPTKQASA